MAIGFKLTPSDLRKLQSGSPEARAMVYKAASRRYAKEQAIKRALSDNPAYNRAVLFGKIKRGAKGLYEYAKSDKPRKLIGSASRSIAKFRGKKRGLYDLWRTSI